MRRSDSCQQEPASLQLLKKNPESFDSVALWETHLDERHSVIHCYDKTGSTELFISHDSPVRGQKVKYGAPNLLNKLQDIFNVTSSAAF